MSPVLFTLYATLASFSFTNIKQREDKPLLSLPVNDYNEYEHLPCMCSIISYWEDLD